MNTISGSAAPSKVALWSGRVLSALPVLMLLLSGAMKVKMANEVVENPEAPIFPPKLLVPLAIIEIGCVLIYLIPQTAVLGAVLITGYLGGAVATHFMKEEFVQCLIPFGLGVVAWLGLFLRDGRVRALLPLRT